VAKAIHDYYRQYAIPAEIVRQHGDHRRKRAGLRGKRLVRNRGAQGTPPEIVEKLNQAVNAVLADPRLQPRLAELGGQPMPMTPAEFGKLVAAETEKWGKVIKLAGIKPE